MSSRRSRQSLTLPIIWAGNLNVPLANDQPKTTANADPLDHLHVRSSGELDFLFQRYSRLVLAIAHRVLGDPYEAEEVLQEVFLYVYRKSQIFNPSKGSVKTWIIQIAFSRALDRKVYLARRASYAAEDIASLQLRGETDLEQQIDSKLSREHLERAFSELTAMQRRTIEFFYFEGFDLREISELLSEPLGRVRHHLYRGLERLRKNSHLHRLRL